MENEEQQPNEKSRRIKINEMTEQDKKAFQENRKKMRENSERKLAEIASKRSGTFISKPDKIIFKDFAVGEPYSQTIYLTNTDKMQNSFKLLPLPEAIRDYFEIIYAPPGKLTSGMSCQITIRFYPQLSEDINDTFALLAETGPVNIPLICTSQKALVRCKQPVLDFQQVIYGEDSVKHIKLVNEGALQTEVTIKSAQGFDIMTKTENFSEKGSTMKQSTSSQKDDVGGNLEKCLSQLKFQKTYTIQGYSTLSIPIQYIPNEKGPFQLPLLVYFENYLHSPPIEVTFKGECIEVPIYVEKELYDFEICLLNHIYREKIVFYNRSQGAMKVQIIAPKETNNFFEFNPMLGYIQGNSKFEVWVKMSAEKDLLTVCQKYLTGQGLLEIPFKLIGADQVVPVSFMIKAKLTIDTIQVTPGKLNFGTLYEGTASRMFLTLENLSDLPQEIIFYPLPKEISVQMDLIPIKLLPKETFQINLIYRSGKVIDNKKDEGYLHCKIITGTISTRDIRIPFSCEIKKSPLEFSAMKIDMPVLQIEENSNTSIIVKNTSYKEMIFEFFLPVPEICGLRINPMVSKIKPDQELEIMIKYSSFFKKLKAYTLLELNQKYDNDPTISFENKMKTIKRQEEEKKRLAEEALQAQQDDPKKGKDSKKDAKQDKGQQKLTKQQQQELEAEMKRQEELEKQRLEEERKRKEEIEANFDMEGELAKLGGKLLEFNQNTQNYSQHYTWLIPFYFKYVDQSDTNKLTTFIEVTTVSVEKSLVLNSTLIDFGEIAVGIREIRELYITNYSDQVADIKMEILPEGSGYSVINALRPIQPKATRTLVVQFQPQEEQPFEETLKINCRTTCISAKLKGKGVKPEVQVVPKDGLLNIGGVVLGESCERSFQIKNISNFEIKLKIVSKAHGIYNKNGSKVFSFIPSEATIDAHEEIDINIIFKPDRISDKFFELVAIDVPNQKDEKQLFVHGSCYPRSAYICHYQPYLKLPQAKDLNVKIERAFDFLKIKDEETIFSPHNSKIVLEFTKIKVEDQKKDPSQLDEKSYTRKIQIGNCKIMSDPKLEKACTYDM